jgi:Spy/CpxP family protein refolding chaperone
MKLFRYGMMALALALAMPAVAQTQSTSTDMQVLAAKVKVQADKKALIAQNMQLTDSEATSFWPIYDAYQQDLWKINDRLTATIVEYSDAYNKGPVDNATAKKLLHELLAIQKSESELQQSYVPKLEMVLPETKVARYIQIENKIRALVHYELASKIPLIE